MTAGLGILAHLAAIEDRVSSGVMRFAGAANRLEVERRNSVWDGGNCSRSKAAGLFLCHEEEHALNSRRPLSFANLDLARTLKLLALSLNANRNKMIKRSHVHWAR